jgi:hypothetical protein
MIEKLWEHLNLIKVFTKKRGEKPDLVDGIILRNGATVEAVAHSIHRSLVDSLKYALVWVKIALFFVSILLPKESFIISVIRPGGDCKEDFRYINPFKTKNKESLNYFLAIY